MNRRCPLCDGTRGRPVWREGGLRYLRCSRCGAVFSDISAEAYAAAARNAWHEDDVSDATAAFYGTARELAHARFLERFGISGNGRLLDVGCGLGYFLGRAATAGWDVHGCDTSQPWVEVARGRVGSERVALGEVTPGLFGGDFEMITAWDVLEHVHDPLPFLAVLAALLAPGGRLFIRTPNLAWVYPTYAARRHLLGADVELGPANHVVYYDAATLRRALRSVGLTVAQWPVLPPPQVSIGNRDPAAAGRASPVTRVKNLHAATAERIGALTRGRLLLGSDLDAIAGRIR